MDYYTKAEAKLAQIAKAQNITILAIESSCDETACAILRNTKVLSNSVASQIEIHRRFGGVVPEIASRNHTLAIKNIVDEALHQSGLVLDDIDCIAVTYGAGLLGALLVGVSYAKALAFATNKPLIAVNHIKGHICANYIDNAALVPPYICLIASGGHTAIVKVDDFVDVKLLGGTQDDAVGEAFDKVARALGLPYPGGPQIQEMAKEGKANLVLPTPLKSQKGYDFSFSGLKTAVVNHLHNSAQKGEAIDVADVACSFQEKATDILAETAVRACRENGLDKLVIAGGVGANEMLRAKISKYGKNAGLGVFYPPLKYCTDNAAMIAACAYFMIRQGCKPARLSLDASASVKITD